jgi:hypothetical protein
LAILNRQAEGQEISPSPHKAVRISPRLCLVNKSIIILVGYNTTANELIKKMLLFGENSKPP